MLFMAERLKDNLHTLRLVRGLTQQEVSEIALISRSAYSRIETGKKTPDLPTLYLLANYYGTGIDPLLNAELKSRPHMSRT